MAVVIPCLDEEACIGQVVSSFRAELPEARVIVVDNNSRDATAAVAARAGAVVVHESRQGKGFALMTGFAAAGHVDYCIMVDGDSTYSAADVHRLLEAAATGCDMVVGSRTARAEEGSFPAGHTLGNRLFTGVVRLLFGYRTTDLFSGYRVLSRRFLDSVPLLAQGFEVEAELAIQTRILGLRTTEIPVRYGPRSPDSASKLRTFSDGYRILMAILVYFRDYRPLGFFGAWATLFLCLSLAGGALVLSDYLASGLVHRIPMAVLSAALFLLAALAFTCGVLLSSISRRTAEVKSLLLWHAGLPLQTPPEQPTDDVCSDLAGP